jgi:hypothetical protein
MKIHIPSGFEFQGLYCYPNPEQDQSYYYLPGDLQPQRDTAGKPMLTLVTVGSGGYLQLSVLWDAPLETMEALRQEIAQRQGLGNPAVLRLAFAPVTVKSASLLLGDDSGTLCELQKTHSSGFPPYSTLFNVQLNAEQQTQVAAALNGREGFLQIQYDASLQAFAAATGKLSGDATATILQLKDEQQNETLEITPQEVQKYLQEAILHGDLQLTVNAGDNAPDNLEERVRVRVLSQAAELLLRFLRNETRIPDITRLEVTASLTEPVVTDLALQTDIASWFKDGTGAGHITPSPGSSPTPLPGGQPTAPPGGSEQLQQKKLNVHLDFSATEAPVGLVRVRLGSAQATLSPPDFKSVELPAAQAGERLSVETSYTTGGSSYESQPSSPVADGLALAPEHLGLVQVTVDAHALEAAGAKKARIWLRYQPESQGVADESTFYFRHSEWQANWFLISRSESLAGVLEYEWQVTKANDELVKHERVKARSPTIILSL